MQYARAFDFGRSISRRHFPLKQNRRTPRFQRSVDQEGIHQVGAGTISFLRSISTPPFFNVVLFPQKGVRHPDCPSIVHVRHVRRVHAGAARTELDHSQYLDDVGCICADHRHAISNVSLEERVPPQHDLLGSDPILPSLLYVCTSSHFLSIVALFTVFQSYTVALVCGIYAAQGNADTGLFHGNPSSPPHMFFSLRCS